MFKRKSVSLLFCHTTYSLCYHRGFVNRYKVLNGEYHRKCLTNVSNLILLVETGNIQMPSQWCKFHNVVVILFVTEWHW